MAFSQPFPPHHHHSSNPVSQAQALQLLSAYISAATTTDEPLEPVTTLTASGPGSSVSSVVLHHLRRIERGLRGESPDADLEFGNLGGKELRGLRQVYKAGLGLGREVERAEGDGGERAVKEGGRARMVEGKTLEEEGWQDSREYEQEWEITEREIRPRSQEATERVKPRPLMTDGSADKAEKKRLKKEKRMREKREREAQRKRETDAEHVMVN